MKKLLVLLTVLVSLGASGQDRLKQWGIGGQVYYSDAVWTHAASGTDSLNSLDKGILGLNPQFWYIFEVDRNLIIQTGLQLGTTGFKRRASNVQYQKVYHPDMPVIQDNLQGDPRHIDFFYRNYTIGLPVFFNREIISLRKSISLRYYFSPGISFNFLLSDKTIARTRGFGFDGKNRFVLNNIYDSRSFGMQLHIGGRAEYLLSGRYRAHIQPVLNLPLLTTFKGDNRAFVPSFGVNLAVSMLPGKLASEE